MSKEYSIVPFWFTDSSFEPYLANEHKNFVRKFLGWIVGDNKIVLVAGSHIQHKNLTQGISILARQDPDKIPEEIKALLDSDLENPIIAGTGAFSPRGDNDIEGWESLGFKISTPEEFQSIIIEALELPISRILQRRD